MAVTAIWRVLAICRAALTAISTVAPHRLVCTLRKHRLILAAIKHAIIAFLAISLIRYAVAAIVSPVAGRTHWLRLIRVPAVFKRVCAVVAVLAFRNHAVAAFLKNADTFV